MQLAPFAQAQETEEMLVRPLAQLRLGQVLVRDAVCVPQFHDPNEFGFRIGELRVRRIRSAALVGRSFTRILDAEETGDDQHLAQAAVLLRGDQHARQLHVHRQPRHGAADVRQFAVGIDRAKLGQLLPAVGDRARIRRLQKWKVLDPPQAQRQHPQDHAGQCGAADFRVGVGVARQEIGFRINAVAGARRDAAAAALALVGAGLRDRLDVQAVEFLPRAIALDPRIARIDHEMDARHGQRGFGDVGRQHDPPLRAGIEHPVLVAHGQPRVQRQHFGMPVFALLQRLVRVADLAFAGQEDQGVAHRRDARDFVAGGDDAVQHRAVARVVIVAPLVATLVATFVQRPIAHFDRITAAFHAHHRRIAEVLREAFGVDGRRGDDHFQVAAFDKQLLEIAEQEVDVETALVRLVDDQGVVGRQPAVGLDLGQQDAVGHELDRGALADVVVEAHLISHDVADQGAERRLQFFGDALGDRARGDPARLGAADHAGGAATGGQAQFRQLRGLARTGFASDHDHLMLADQLDDALGLAGDGQRRVDLDRGRQRRRTGLARRDRWRQRVGERGLQRGIAGLAAPARPQPEQPPAVARQRPIDRAPGGLEDAVVRFAGAGAA